MENVRLLIDNITEYQPKDGFFQEITRAVFAHVDEEYDEAVEVSLVLTVDEDIAGMNAEYRGKEGATDVLSFPMGDEDGMLGDIVISVETATRQANEREIALEREIAFLYIHGLLHLLGFDHETGEEDEKEMFDLQEAVLKSLVDAGLVP